MEIWKKHMKTYYDIMNWNVTPIQLTNSHQCTFGPHSPPPPTLPPQPRAFWWKTIPWWSFFRSRHTFIKWGAQTFKWQRQANHIVKILSRSCHSSPIWKVTPPSFWSSHRSGNLGEFLNSPTLNSTKPIIPPSSEEVHCSIAICPEVPVLWETNP